MGNTISNVMTVAATEPQSPYFAAAKSPAARLRLPMLKNPIANRDVKDTRLIVKKKIVQSTNLDVVLFNDIKNGQLTLNMYHTLYESLCLFMPLGRKFILFRIWVMDSRLYQIIYDQIEEDRDSLAIAKDTWILHVLCDPSNMIVRPERYRSEERCVNLENNCALGILCEDTFDEFWRSNS